MLTVFISFFSVFTYPTFSYAESICAKSYDELDASPTLQKVKPLLNKSKSTGFVNKTKGSYFFIHSSNPFKIVFYTTGFLDLYGIKRESSIQFCDENNVLTVIGMGRHQRLYIEGLFLLFGSQSDRESFTQGPMPLELAHKNNVDPHLLLAVEEQH